VWHAALTAARVRRARDCGLAVLAWTPNSAHHIDRVLGYGVQGVITDLPDVARDLVDRTRAAAPALAA
jgi:glycerophosphoryl diester phosphodiesterase